MKKATYIIAGAQVLLLIAMWADITLNPTDKAGQGMAYGFLMIGAIFVAICIIPALFLAQSEKWQGLGVGLAALPIVVALFAMAG